MVLRQVHHGARAPPSSILPSLGGLLGSAAFEYAVDGVLVLSEFIGAAQTLGSGAILVNPFNTDALAKAIYEALHMPEEERVEPSEADSGYDGEYNEAGEPEGYGQFYLLPVAVHEVGHVLGLGHSATPSDVMAPYYRAELTELSPNDIERCQKLYPRAATQQKRRSASGPSA